MTADEAALAGAERIVRFCLGLKANQELLVIADETTLDVASTIAEAASSLGVLPMIVLVPVALQRRVRRDSNLGSLIQGAAREAKAILLCVNASPDCLAFRERIIVTQWTARTRIGHMPGASFEVLKLANVDFDQLISDCHGIECAMARGSTLEFVTHAADGKPYRLSADIGGWERLPVASDGVIGDGMWGNVPSGETYIAPIEGTAHGSIVINGSIDGLVIEPGNELVVSFRQGRVERIEPQDSSAAQWLHHTQIQVAQARGDHNWSNLAEIGIGVNPGVQHLTGNMLLDEKVACTAHIAIGSNTFMGGAVDSVIHCDMVVRDPTILIDGKIILDGGLLCLRESEWGDDYKKVPLANSPLQTALSVTSSGIETLTSADGRLQRVLLSEPGRNSACFVGNYETSRLAHAVYTCLSRHSRWSRVEQLVECAGLDIETIRRVLYVLWAHDLVRIRGDTLGEDRHE